MRNMSMRWRESFMLKFIDLYRNQDCLWNTKNDLYKNKHAREKALNAIVKEMGMAGLTTTDVKNKIKVIRTMYKKEYILVRNSRKRGVDPDDVYQPRLFWFKKADAFLRRVTTSKENLSDIESSFIEDNAEDIDIYEEHNYPESNEISEECNVREMFCKQLSRPFLREFIEMYKQNPCLWKMKSPEYADKELKKEAYCRLIRKCLEVNPKADKDFVVRKLNCLRTTFRKTLTRVLESRKNGEIYEPTLWYFDLMLFLVEEEESAMGVSFSQDFFQRQESEMQMVESEDIDPLAPQYLMESEYLLEDTPSPSEEKPKQHTSDQYCDKSPRSSKNAKKIEWFGQIDENDAFGKVVSCRIKNMDSDQRIIAEKLISDILYHGQLKNLTSGTSILIDNGD